MESMLELFRDVTSANRQITFTLSGYTPSCRWLKHQDIGKIKKKKKIAACRHRFRSEE